MFLLNKLHDTLPVDARLAAGVDASLLRLRNAFSLPLAADVGFELGKHCQHAEEGSACRSTGVHALLEYTKVSAFVLDLMRNVGKVA